MDRPTEDGTADGRAEGAALPQIERLRFPLRRRVLNVLRSDRLTPNMQRIVLGGADLADFASASPGDHVKIFVPDGAGGLAARDYTPRRFDAERGELVLDFALHEAGPATLWALSARPGDRLELGGPRGSQVIGGPVAAWLLIGDETALPSIGRRIEEMPAGMPVTALVAVPEAADEQRFDTTAALDCRWVHRRDPTDPAPLLAALDGIALPPRCFVWIAAEAGVARALRDALTGGRGHPLAWMKAAGYWVEGEAEASAKEL